MRWVPMGESAYLVKDIQPVTPPQLAHWIRSLSIAGVQNVVACYDSVGVYYDPDRCDLSALLALSMDQCPEKSFSGRLHHIPVCYELGEDLVDVIEQLQLSKSEFIHLHSGMTYDCHAIGFCPGFPYLGYLADRISNVARKQSPRPRIEPGSVAIAHRQTGIYPLVRPGGWNLIGKTPLEIVDVAERYFPIQVGDQVEFYAISVKEYEDRLGERL